MQPTVSIIVPTYNRPDLLRACLAALAQDPQLHKEVIVVNDAGDDVSTVLAPFEGAFALRLIDLATNRGHVASRNEGIAVARADVIVLCDDDDILLPGHVRDVVGAVSQTPSQVIYTDAEIVTYRMTGHCREPLKRRLFAYAYDPTLLRKWNTIIPSGIAYARSWHDRLGLFDEEVYHYWDWDFFLRAGAIAPLRRIPQASVLYMVSDRGHNLSADPNSMSSHLLRLQEKHQLGPLPTSSFALMQQEPALAGSQRTTEVLWDG
ncbi:MAG: glycosyltransferase family 2 protein, partial [Firmicutes bacterium]|nr:glycosyltransferase family 2 protein [Bacillota bacterium]